MERFAVGTLSAGSTGRQGNTVDEIFHRLDVHRDGQGQSVRVAVTRSHCLPVKCNNTHLHGQTYSEMRYPRIIEFSERTHIHGINNNKCFSLQKCHFFLLKIEENISAFRNLRPKNVIFAVYFTHFLQITTSRGRPCNWGIALYTHVT